jgi:hypothetical protein
MAGYAWRIDTWPNVEDIGPIEPVDTVIEGPRDAPQDLLDRLAKREGKRFRMKDDDGFLYCKGRILFADKDDEDSELGFAPLWDYGTPGLGCTSIEYWEKSAKTGTYSWQEL